MSTDAQARRRRKDPQHAPFAELQRFLTADPEAHVVSLLQSDISGAAVLKICAVRGLDHLPILRRFLAEHGIPTVVQTTEGIGEEFGRAVLGEQEMADLVDEVRFAATEAPQSADEDRIIDFLRCVCSVQRGERDPFSPDEDEDAVSDFTDEDLEEAMDAI